MSKKKHPDELRLSGFWLAGAHEDDFITCAHFFPDDDNITDEEREDIAGFLMVGRVDEGWHRSYVASRCHPTKPVEYGKSLS